jgi:hypothetical protein
MSKSTVENPKSLFNLNLDGARGENESFQDYRNRLKQNQMVLKLYKQLGRARFQEMFPEGITAEMFNQKSPTNEG